MRFLFVMDPPARIGIRTDTTFVIMLEAQARGHEVLHCEASDLGLEHDAPVAVARPARLQRVEGAALLLGEPKTVSFGDCDAVWMRKDPPYDLEYFFATLLLERARGKTLVVNDPRGLRDANEKLYSMNLPQYIPPTILTRSAARLRAFLDEQGGEMIVKPLDGAGGRGVFHCKAGDRNVPSILEMSTDFGAKWVIGQRYLPAARHGDKRILLLDGEVIGAVLRVPREDETRGNLHVGGRAERTVLDAREREICAALGPLLRRDGLWFVGIDIIGGMLTEVNVTSPTGVQEVNALEDKKLEGVIVDWLERSAAAARASR
jgi:glutathione synthase